MANENEREIFMKSLKALSDVVSVLGDPITKHPTLGTCVKAPKSQDTFETQLFRPHS